MAVDLSGMSRSQLEKLRNDVDNAIEKAKEKDRADAKSAAEKAAAEFGFSLDDLTGDGSGRNRRTSRKSGPKTISDPKYANPADPDETWTGKGRQPKWYRQAMDDGMKPEQLEIENNR